jgi:RHS repeat-associated protein
VPGPARLVGFGISRNGTGRHRAGRHLLAWTSRAVAPLMVAGVLVTVATPQAGAATRPKPTAAAPVPTTAPDRVSAVLSAKASRKPVEITGERTERSTTWALPNGTFRTDTTTAPTRVRRSDGSWTPVDYTLVDTGKGISPKASPVAVTFSPGGKGPAVTLTENGKSIDMGWATTLPKPRLDGPRASYDLGNGTSLVLAATSEGFEQSLVLAKPPTSAPQLRLGFNPKGLSLKGNDRGGFDFEAPAPTAAAKAPAGKTGAGRAAAGKAGAAKGPQQVFTMPAPVMYSAAWDKVAEEHTQVQAVTAKLGKAADGSPVLDLSAAMGFLTDPKTVYPVTIDPTIDSVTQVGDTYVTQQNTTDHSSDYDIRIGKSSSGNLRRSLVRFGAASAVSGMHVTNATLSLYNVYTGSCTASPVYAYPVTADYSMTGVRWATQPTIDSSGTYTGSGTFAYGLEPGCANGTGTVDVTAMTQAWANGTLADYGLELRDAEVSQTTEKRFCAMNIDSGGWSACTAPTRYPMLSVTYNSIPGVPTGVDYTPHVIGANGYNYVTSLTPTVTGIATNADGSPYRLEVLVQHHTAYPGEGTGTVWTGLSGWTNPGAAATVTVPSGNLLAGKHYQYQVRSSVASGASGTDTSAWTALAGMNANVNFPPAPSISCPTYQANRYTAYNGAGDTCTLDVAAGDGAGYYWSLDDPNPTTFVNDSSNTGAPKTITITPATGWHTLYALARDTALHRSPITSYTFGVGVGAVLSPAANAATAKAAALKASTSSGFNQVTYQWAPGTTSGTWTDLPTAHVTPDGSSTPISSWPQTGTTTGNLTTFSGLNWNVAATATAASMPDGALRIRACYSLNGGTQSCSDPTTFTLAVTTFGRGAAMAQLGPGTVSLTTGDFQVTSADASVTGLSVGRTATSFAPAAANTGPTGIFGAGWTASLPGTAAGAGDASLIDNSANGSMVIKSSDGTELTYLKQADDTYKGVDPANDGSVLSYSTTIRNPADSSDNTNYTGWQLKDTSGTVTTWTQTAGTWLVKWVDAAGSEGETTYARDANGRVTTILGPIPTGVTCTTNSILTGCVALQLTYATSTTATGTTEATWGNYTGLVSGITWTGYDPATSAMTTKQVAAYAYDSTGHLRATWDPRLTTPLKVRYSYDGNGRLSTITPPGRNAWTLNYDTTGRLASVSRTDPANGTATQAVAYDLAVSGVTGAPDVSGTTATSWGQTSDLAYTGAAVFPASHVPTVNAGTGAYTPTSAQWPYARITYADVNGKTVNTAAYGAGAWQINSTRYDTNGNQIWSLDAGNRAQALSPTSATDPYAASQTSTVTRANLLATESTYSADGVDLLTTLGPAHPVRLSNGAITSARVKTTNTYDQSAPAGGPYHLVTTSTVTPVSLDGANVPAADSRSTLTGYDPIDGASNTGSTSGWVLRKATTVTTQMGTSPSSNDLVAKSRYDASGRTVESRLPGATGSDPATTLSTYYTTAANAAYPACGGKAYWAGILCRKGPAGQPSSGPAVSSTTYTYDLYGAALTAVDSSATASRTTTNTYDNVGRPYSTTVVVSGLSGSTAVPTTVLGYDVNTGDQLTIAQGTTSLAVTYDAIGRQITQVDADSNTTTSSYDIDGRVSTLNDGQGTYTYTYDNSVDHRGLVTSINAGMGSLSTFNGTYDADGRLASQTMPNGTSAVGVFDNIGTPRSLTYTLPPSNGVSNTLTFAAMPDAFAETVHAEAPGSAQDNGYDNAGRLTSVADTIAGACTTRAYGFDAQGDRTSLTTYGSGTAGTCQTSTAASTVTTTYDTANRIATSAGYTYDALGRATTVPANNLSSGTGNLTVAYYDTDMPNTLTQGTAGKTFTLDPAGRYRTATDTTSGSETRRIKNHYGSQTNDSPTWIATSTDAGMTWTWERYVSAFNGMSAIQASDGSSILQLADLRGNIAATVPNQTTAAGTTISSYFETTEYGQPRSGSDLRPRYGWIGAQERSSDALAGLVLMGVRLYNPTSGQFLSADPMVGGNSNAYNYPTNPLGSCDVTGAAAWKCETKCHIVCNGATIMQANGVGYGRTYAEAKADAERDVDRYIASKSELRGCYKRHCTNKPRCSQNWAYKNFMMMSHAAAWYYNDQAIPMRYRPWWQWIWVGVRSGRVVAV